MVRTGDDADSYFIEDGEASVFVGGNHTRTLGAGDGFGEIALRSDRPRTATVSVGETLDVFRLPRHIFLEAVTGSPHALQAGETLVAGRIAELGHVDH